jgi:hypothetical protein
MTKATLKDTKSVIFQAYKDVLNELEKNRVVDSKQVKNDIILNNADNIKSPINKLEEFVSGFDSILEQYNNIKEAIKIKKEELKSIYDIEIKTGTLEALIITIEKLEQEKKDKENEIEKMFKKGQDDLKKQLEYEEEEEKRKIRKMKQLELDELEEKMREKQKQVDLENEKKEDLIRLKYKELNEIIEDLEKREKDVISKNDLIENLQKEIETIKKDTIEDVTNELQKKQNVQIKVIESKYDNKTNLLEEKINDKNERIEELKDENETLKIELKEAYNELKELAEKAVDNSKSNELAGELGKALRAKNN